MHLALGASLVHASHKILLCTIRMSITGGPSFDRHEVLAASQVVTKMPGIDPAASPAVGFLLPGPQPTRLPPRTAQELDLRQGGSGQHGQRALMASGWPMQSVLELWALPQAVPEARRHTRQVLEQWGLAELSETVELLVSEIVTNAVQASAGPAGSRHDHVEFDDASTLLFWLAGDGERALIQIWDSCERKPQRRDAGTAAESGRGLLLVEALTAEWGSYAPNGWAGKIVWALVSGA
jgi:anti-sigma regulatory factor (Ser/Thr protein kinase)